MEQRMTLNVAELAKELGICRPKAYQIVKRKDFPVINVGKRIIIPRVALQDWLMANTTGNHAGTTANGR